MTKTADRDTNTVICATCLRCQHRGAVSAELLRRYGLSPNVTLAYLSRMVKCEVCGSKAVKLERRSMAGAQAFVAHAGS